MERRKTNRVKGPHQVKKTAASQALEYLAINYQMFGGQTLQGLSGINYLESHQQSSDLLLPVIVWTRDQV